MAGDVPPETDKESAENSANGNQMLAEAIRKMTESLLANKGSTSGPQVRDDFKVMDEFHKYKPAPFKGSPNPLDAENWLLEMEKRMELLEVEDRLRVKIAMYYLKDAAGHWWTVTKTKEGMQNLTWNEFKELFLQKCFPVALKNAKILEFIQLDQEKEGLSILEYDMRFEELSRYATDMVKTEHLKAIKYQKGLLPDIRFKLAQQMLTSRNEIFERELIIEVAYKEFREGKDRKRSNFNNRKEPPKKLRPENAPKSGYEVVHSNNVQERTCYECRKPGHLRRNLPLLNGQSFDTVIVVTTLHTTGLIKRDQRHRLINKERRLQQ
ncbi:uncharacterized protein LOC113294619 [Papaver somniferum]|uniref:uncharacterized protein LOC113294619 n=1 Tax=Papaver somniferum TaxID=3469 RepID=UPI000E6FE1B6|nr:uncharacterized protein LOC113294619 [Papaver somniferum]